ncbi:MAG: hypothetical protein OER88_01870 [Planctomycetota bacterium]|nr:hypothetical protein [Planctomycetota bacterium]
MTRPWLEAMRDYVDGRMDAAEAERFEQELAADPERRRLMETYELVARATPGAGPACDVSFDDLAVSAAPRRGRAWLVAAVLMLAVGGAWWWAQRPGGSDGSPGARAVVVLQAIDLAVAPAPAPAPLPAWLDEHTVSDEYGLYWLTLLEDAQLLGRLAERPVLLFVDFPGCPLCLRYEREAFLDDRVIAAAQSFALVRLDWRETPLALRDDPREGWPLFHVLSPDGKKHRTFKGYHEAATFAAQLATSGAAARAQGAYEAPPWDQVHEAVRRLKAVERGEGPVSVRLATCADLATKRGSIGRLARAWRARFAEDVRDEIRAARHASPGTAQALLARAVKTYAGTPWKDDLSRILAALRDHGRFPQLTTNR